MTPPLKKAAGPKNLVVFVFSLLMSAPGMAAPSSEPCYNVCWSECTDEMKLATCAPIDPQNERICFVLYGECARLENGACGWRGLPDIQACLNHPSAYRMRYEEMQNRLTHQRREGPP